MQIIVVGIGGNGQTYFMKYLKEKSFQINNLSDNDKLKHLSCPSKLLNKHKGCKIIYLYNKSFDAICSHYRRKWPIKQMNKIKINNNCNIKKVQNYFKFTESNLFDYFGCINHFLRWYKFKNNIYFLNLSKINKHELSNFLKCDKSIFDNLIFDSTKRTNYDDLKNQYPLSNIMYTHIDNYIDNLSIHKNKKYI